MPEREGYIEGVPCWIDTSQPDPQAAAEFYSGLLGWELEEMMPADAPGNYIVGRIRGRDVAAISSQGEGAPPMAVWNTYIWVESADAAAAKVYDAGGKVLMEPFDVMEAGRMAVCADPEGAVFCVWQAAGHKGARVVNEHGSLVFNTLNTRDVEAAAAFYGAIFGWELLDPGSNFPMWRRPGYGDHLEQLNPGMREQMASMGAPAGFEDVVAAVAPLGDGQAHWGVTFAVDDADAIAAKAAELGGRVVMPPTDAPWVRSTTLSDPAGATFTASQFVLENRDLGRSDASAANAA